MLFNVLDDATERYAAWMNEYDVVRYTESRFMHHTVTSLQQFIVGANNDTNITWAIAAIVDGNKTPVPAHIGNIKLGNINRFHSTAEIGLIIGDQRFWGRGIATEAIGLVTEYALHDLEIRRVCAGAYEKNQGSIRVFLKNRYEISSIDKGKCLFEGAVMDCVSLVKFSDKFV